jgi:hypothetical protein
MSDKATKTDLFRMLADAVRNTPGAIPIEPVRDAQPEPKSKKGSEPKRVAKIKSIRASSSRKRRR